MQPTAYSSLSECMPLRTGHKKSRSPKAPAVQLVVCPDKNRMALVPPPVPAECSSSPVWLSGPSRPYRKVPSLRQNARHFHSAQLRQIRHNLRYERVLHQLANLLLPISFSTGEQIRHADLE